MRAPRTMNVIIVMPINDPKFLGMNGITSLPKERTAAVTATGVTESCEDVIRSSSFVNIFDKYNSPS
jgi:hypothetical protein